MSVKPRVLVTDYVHQHLIEGLRDRGFLTEVNFEITLPEVLEIVHNFEGIIINSKIICDRQLFDKAKNLKWVARLGSGLEIIDRKYAESLGINVISTPTGNCDAVGEQALGMLLSLTHNICKANQETKNWQWNREENRGYEIKGKTIGILGFGHTGPAFAQRLMGFECKILIYDPYIVINKLLYPYVEQVSLLELQNNCDIISIHLPLTDETRHFVDKQFFSNCLKPIVLINTARGKNVDTKALINALNDGEVLGAGLDVLENEKLDNFTETEKQLYQKLCHLSNVIITPHIAGWTTESLLRIAEIILEKIDRNKLKCK